MNPKSKRERILLRGIERATQRVRRGATHSVLLSRTRMGIVLLAIIVCAWLYHHEWFVAGNWILGGWVSVFIGVASYHNRLEARLATLRLWLEIKKTNVARLQLAWEGVPSPQVDVSGAHPYAADLDVFTGHSLFRLLDTTISKEGHARLASWLADQNDRPFSFQDWAARQELVRGLSRFPALCDRVRLVAKSTSPHLLDGERIALLVANPFSLPMLPVLLGLACCLALVTGGLVVLWAVGMLPGYWVLSLLVYTFLMLMMGGRLSHVFARTLDLHQELKKLGAIVEVLEARQFRRVEPLQRLRESFRSGEERLSRVITRLGRICSGLSIKAHPIIHLLINIVFPWDMAWAWYLQKVCARLRPSFPVWMDQIATLDAAMALGTFAYLNPDYVWPTRQEAPSLQEVGIVTTAMGHPLLPHHRRVNNDFSLQGVGRLQLVTGSNMSGKSTFLRTIGINVCLAQAGGPVCAKTWTWSWMELHTCIRVGDSLEEGLSYFYAEVKRLKRILDAVQTCDGNPVLYLIDEIFKGTNNRERLLGSEAFIRQLIKGKGLGLVTTHDLELTKLETELTGLTNVHFQETVEEKALRFDYRLRPGPCPTTNALRIMELEGLPVPPKSH